MSTTVFTKVEFSLSALIEKIRLGEITLPDIQRPFVWPNTKVRNLFDSMLKGFPVGYLLFWANVVPEGIRHVGADLKQRVPSSLIVDGQQRLTSLYAVLTGTPIVRDDYRQERIRIAFRPADRVFDVTNAAIEKDAEFIPDPNCTLRGVVRVSEFVAIDGGNMQRSSTRDSFERFRMSGGRKICPASVRTTSKTGVANRL
jgi:hypothetical protein